MKKEKFSIDPKDSPILARKQVCDNKKVCLVDFVHHLLAKNEKKIFSIFSI